MADDEQFSLCWNNFNTNLSAGFHESLIRGDLVDVTLAAEGQLVKAHRLILSVCSPYFRKMFTQMPANQHAFIFLKDVSHSALKDLIQFMYCGEVNVKQDALPAFISTAEALQIKGLTETGESAPAQQSPAKDSTSHHHLPSSGASVTSPRVKPLQRTRIQSYKLDSDDGSSDHEKVVQIQAGPSPATATLVASSSGGGPTATLVTHAVSAAPQQVQIMTTVPSVSQATKRTVTQRASLTPQTSQVMKRAKMSDPLEASEPAAQIQTVQIVKQITQTPAQQSTASAPAAASSSSEPEYVEMPIETINPKAEPEYADDPSEVEAIDAEHDQDQALTEQDQHEHDQDADDSANYVEDETYGDMSKYDESYFTEGDDAKAGASGFGAESYTEGGAADQAAQDQPTVLGPNQIPKPSTWYYVELQYAKNSFGSVLLFRGYRYARQKMFPDAVISWKCSVPDCPAVVLTLGENCLKIKVPAHSHPCYGNRAMVYSKHASQLAPQYQNVQSVQQESTKPPPLLLAHQIPMPSIWYTSPLKFYRNKVCKLSVRFNGHDYNMEKKTRAGDTITWICPQPGCTSFIITRGKDQVWLCPRPHNHEPIKLKVLKPKAAGVDQKGKDGDQKQGESAQKKVDNDRKNDNVPKEDSATIKKEEVDPMGEDVEYIEIKVEPLEIE